MSDIEKALNTLNNQAHVFVHNIDALQQLIHRLNYKWWHDEQGNKLDRNKGELIALMHSELSECLEGERKNLMDDKITYRKMAEVELADTVIRILDYAEGFGYNVVGAIIQKLQYNVHRADHSHEQRNKENGKKF